jgi:pimeloyl-ACP methyl ester carboxylesterase
LGRQGSGPSSCRGRAEEHGGRGDFGAEGAFDPKATRAALARLAAPVLVLAGEVDLNSPPRAMAEYAELFTHARLVIQPGAGHFPWLDDPDQFVATTAAFLG